MTGVSCTSRSEREFTLEGSWYADDETQAAAKIVSEPEDKRWRMREFKVADLDYNQLRVFYDFLSDLLQKQE